MFDGTLELIQSDLCVNYLNLYNNILRDRIRDTEFEMHINPLENIWKSITSKQSR